MDELQFNSIDRHDLDDTGQHIIGESDCSVCSHLECSPEECEVRRLLSQISESQIKVSVAASYASIALSLIMGVGCFIAHVWCHILGIAFTITWWEASIIMAPFGGVLVLRIRSKIPWLIKENKAPVE